MMLNAYLMTLKNASGEDVISAGVGGFYDTWVLDPDDATARLMFESDGDILVDSAGLGYTDIGDWVTPKLSAPGLYEIRATLTSGTFTTGTAGTWLALSTSREWTVTRTTVGSKETTFTIEIRYDGGAVLASASYTLNATVDSGA